MLTVVVFFYTFFFSGAPRPRIETYSSEEYQFRGGRGVEYVDVLGDMMAYTASGQYVIKRAPTDHYMPPKDAPAIDEIQEGGDVTEQDLTGEAAKEDVAGTFIKISYKSTTGANCSCS